MPDFNINEFNESMFVSFFNKLPPSPKICCSSEYFSGNIILEKLNGNIEFETSNGLVDLKIEVCEWYMEIRLR